MGEANDGKRTLDEHGAKPLSSLRKCATESAKWLGELMGSLP